MRADTVTSTIYTSSTDSSEESPRQRREAEHPQIGYSLDELNAKRSEPKWRVMRFGAIAIFWTIWAALLAGSILIIVLNNHDVKSTTAAPTTTIKAH